MKNYISIKVKTFLFLIGFVIIVFSGCSKYQYVYVNSNLYQNENKEYFVGNDTVVIRFTFKGKNSPIQVTIYNKLLKPLYIDWKRSTAIFEYEQVNDFFNDSTQPNFIAPQSYINISSYPLTTEFYNINKNDSITPVTFTTENGTSKEFLHTYSEQTSPLHFRCIFALSTNEDFSSLTFYDNSFWISGIIRTMTNPSSITYQPSNQFYIKKSTTFTKIFAGTAGCLFFTGAFLYALGNMENQDENEGE
ncbi:MAG TPA: hypothetical protein PKK00_01950 [Bacteroidales bacterium]|nr:hypothetical protein [Bacteroidales bacterium]HPS15809.1 hypothetical protein [Bacteroidales bacterium]